VSGAPEAASQPILADLNGMHRWTAWQTEQVSSRTKPTKVPYGPGVAAESDNPATWMLPGEAAAVAAALPKPFGAGGVGIFLGGLDGPWADWSLGGIDYDSCIGPDGIAAWAMDGLRLVGSYAEVSPSGTGIKQFFIYRTSQAAALKAALGIKNTGRKWSRRGAGKDHPEAIEVYLEKRYFAVTLDRLGGGGCWGDLAVLDLERAGRLAQEIVPRLTGRAAGVGEVASVIGAVGAAAGAQDMVFRGGSSGGRGWGGGEAFALVIASSPGLERLWRGDFSDLGEDRSRSAIGFHLAAWLKAYGFGMEEARAIVDTHAYGGADWLAEKDVASGGREWARAWENAPPPPFSRVPMREGYSSRDANPYMAGRGGQGAGVAGGNIPAGVGGADGRPVIQVKAGHLSETVDQAEAALVAGGFPVYTRDKYLVAPSTKEVRVRGGGMATVAGLHRLGAAALMDMLGRAAVWCKWDGRGQKLVPCDPPATVVAVLLERPGPRVFPEISGIVATPGLRGDGTISDTLGWDAGLGVHRVEDRWLRLPGGWLDRVPVKADAEKGLALLGGLLAAYPFVDRVDRSVAFAMILSCVCRAAVPVAPVFAISATVAGTGKSHLVDLASAIAVGRRCPAAAAGERDEETEKRLGGLIYAGYPIVSIDNVNGVLRSTTLNQVATQDRVQIRLLGSSDMPEVESRTVFTVNGNGLVLSGDLVRRTLPCRLDAGVERPEMREFAFDPVRVVEADRGPYVAAALTMLRAHAAAGFPGAVGMKALGSYEDWSKLVRGTLIWLGEEDPLVAMELARLEDPDLALLRDMLTGWMRRFGTEPHTVSEAATMALTVGGGMGGGMGGGQGGASGFAGGVGGSGGGGASVISEAEAEVKRRAAEEAGAAVAVGDAEARASFVDAIHRVAGSRGVVDPQRLGQWLHNHAGQIQAGMRFVRAGQYGHSTKWRVERANANVKLLIK